MKTENKKLTFRDGGGEEWLGLRSVRSVGSEQVPAGGGGGPGGGGAEFHTYIFFFCSSSSCRLHQVRKQSDSLLEELQHLPVLLLDVSCGEEERRGGGGEEWVGFKIGGILFL